MTTDNKNAQLCEGLANDIKRLCALPAPSGFESRVGKELAELWGSEFDSLEGDLVGSFLLCKKCGRENAAKILLDAHLDNIGLIVTEVLEGGFVRLTNLGGIDRAILSAADVTLYPRHGGESIRGVIISAPPHLREASDGKLPKIEELLCDVGEGYSREELSEILPIGSAVCFTPSFAEVGKDCLAGTYFDDKACAAVILRAVADAAREELAGDVYISLSAREESSNAAGVKNICHRLRPDYAMAVDVNLADAPDVPARQTVPLRGGISLTHSPTVSRELTRKSIKLCEKNGISFSHYIAAGTTGTNATAINMVDDGIAVIDVGLPIRNMHTYNELLSLADVQALYQFVRAFVADGELAQEFGGANG